MPATRGESAKGEARPSTRARFRSGSRSRYSGEAAWGSLGAEGAGVCLLGAGIRVSCPTMTYLFGSRSGSRSAHGGGVNRTSEGEKGSMPRQLLLVTTPAPPSMTAAWPVVASTAFLGLDDGSPRR